MKDLLIKKLLIVAVLLSVAIPAFPGFTYYRYMSDMPAGELFSKSSVMKKKAKVKRPQSAKKAQKAQKAKDKKLDRDYEKFVRDNKKHSLEIQTPAVRERMKQNVRDANANYKAKKKSNAARTKKGRKKYKR